MFWRKKLFLVVYRCCRQGTFVYKMFSLHNFILTSLPPPQKKNKNIENWGESHLKIVSFFVRLRRGLQNCFFTFVVLIPQRFHWSSLRSLLEARSFGPRCAWNEITQVSRFTTNHKYV